jgi:hypothetical protein
MSGGYRVGAVIGVAIGIALGAVGSARAGTAAPEALHCTNTTSGATWDIQVDLAQGKVDQVPARITDGTIAWEDRTMHYYSFDRRTGRLDMHAASSTGGFYLTDRCVLR